MYSLTRGRLPLMRGSRLPGGRLTPGESAINGTKFRPSSGSDTTFFCSTTKLAVPRVDCSSGAAAVTSTDWDDVAHLEFKVQADLVADAQHDAIAPQPGEPLFCHGDRVGPCRQRKEMVAAAAVRSHGELGVRSTVYQVDDCAVHGQTARIANGPKQLRFGGLSVCHPHRTGAEE